MKALTYKITWTALLLSLSLPLICPAQKPRTRDLGIAPGYMTPGKLNAITDVAGVRVGHVTLIDASKGMHTGVTAILPHGGNLYQDKVPAGYFQGNGFGKIMGISQIIELGEIETPILLTNTLSVPEVAAGVIEWTLNYPGNEKVVSVNAVVGETNDSRINAIRKRLVTKDHAIQAIECAKTGPVAEGNVGAGTGTVAFGFKAGIGTSSRILKQSDGAFTVGVLVQANYGGDLHILGVPVGRMLKDRQVQANSPDGSVMIVVATDAPLSDRNLTRLAKRAILGIGRTGGNMSNGSGDYVLAFSTAPGVRRRRTQYRVESQSTELPNRQMTPLFSAVIEATEEAVYNALISAESTVGRNGKVYEKLPIETVLKLLRKLQRLQ